MALPEIGQNLHELDWRTWFSYIPLGRRSGVSPKHIIQSLADGLSCALPWGPHFRGTAERCKRMERRNMLFATCVLCVCVCVRKQHLYTHTRRRGGTRQGVALTHLLSLYMYIWIFACTTNTHTHIHTTLLSLTGAIPLTGLVCLDTYNVWLSIKKPSTVTGLPPARSLLRPSSRIN